eukprot:3997204-Amphidinium_carterae.1
MLGRNQPLARALRWCDWKVVAYDLALSPQHDLSKPSVRETDCYHRGEGAQPLCSDQNPEGIPSLDAKASTKVQAANELVQFTGFLRTTQVQGSCPRTRADPTCGPYPLSISSCTQDTKMSSTQRARGEVPEQSVSDYAPIYRLSHVSAQCHYVHSPTELVPVRGTHGHFEYPTCVEQEFTAELAFQVALCLSTYANHTGRFKLRVPEPPQTNRDWRQNPGVTQRPRFVQTLFYGQSGLKVCPTQ